MKWFNFRQSRLSLEELEHRRAHRSKGIQGILFVHGLILLFFIAFLGFTLVLAPGISLRKTISLKQQVAEIDRQKSQESRRLKAIYTAAQNNPKFNRTLAYDRGLAYPDETVIRMQPDEQQTAPPPATGSASAENAH